MESLRSSSFSNRVISTCRGGVRLEQGGQEGQGGKGESYGRFIQIVSTLAFWTDSSAVLSIAKYSFLSPSGTGRSRGLEGEGG